MLGRNGGGGGEQTDPTPPVEKKLPHDKIFPNSMLRKINCPGLETMWVRLVMHCIKEASRWGSHASDL